MTSPSTTKTWFEANALSKVLVLLAALEAAEKELDELRGLYADMAQQLGETQTYATKLEKAGDEMRASGILRQFWSEGDAWDAARKAKP